MLNLLGSSTRSARRRPNYLVWGNVAGWTHSYYLVWGTLDADPSGQYLVWGTADDTATTSSGAPASAGRRRS